MNIISAILVTSSLIKWIMVRIGIPTWSISSFPITSTYRVGICLEPTHFHHLSSPLWEGQKDCPIPLCAKYKLTRSRNGYEFPELPGKGQTGDGSHVCCCPLHSGCGLPLPLQSQRVRSWSQLWMQCLCLVYRISLILTNGTLSGSLSSEHIFDGFHHFLVWPKVQLRKLNPKLSTC